MRLNHPDYITLVMIAYNKKRVDGELPLLAHPTPGKIRRACINNYKAGCERKDEPALCAFFGSAEQGKQFLQLIENFETDKFRPLNNFLKGETERTDDTNIELLAWLIGFQYRPYALDKYVTLSDEELALINNDINITAQIEPEPIIIDDGLVKNESEVVNLLENEAGEAPGVNEKKFSVSLNVTSTGKPWKEWAKKAAGILLILAISFTGIYSNWLPPRFFGFRDGNTGCMTWVNDHYEQVPCNEESKGRLILPLNEEKMKNLKMITRMDTLTTWSIGKVYYIKDSNVIKCYTEGGKYPEDINRNLKVLSQHIFDTYLRKKEGSDKDTLASLAK